MSKFSFSLLPSVDIKESINLAVTCEKNNFEAIWVADEIWYRDPWPITVSYTHLPLPTTPYV